jgi:hypothetical protein
MAAHGSTEYSTAPGNDLPTHEQTYERFVFLATLLTLHVIGLVVGLAIGGVNDSWMMALGIFVLAILSLIQGLIFGSYTFAAVVVVIGLLALAGTA